jgi:hypothetical protein
VVNDTFGFRVTHSVRAEWAGVRIVLVRLTGPLFGVVVVLGSSVLADYGVDARFVELRVVTDVDPRSVEPVRGKPNDREEMPWRDRLPDCGSSS